MLQSVTMFIVLWINPLKFEVYSTVDEVYSIEPIIECTKEFTRDLVTSEKTTFLYCKTERLYYSMTGKDTTVIVITGAYDT